MKQVIQIAIVGAAGRMGQALLDHAYTDPELHVVAAIQHPGSVHLGVALGPQKIVATGDLSEHVASCDVIIDFSSPESCVRTARIAAQSGCRFVSGTTGLSDTQLKEVLSCSTQTAVLHSANFSIGVNVLERLVELASESTGSGYDLEVFEAHHKHKVDAPSGTALFLANAAARGRGHNLEEVAAWSRHGQVGTRDQDEIGFQVMRGGDIIGEHTVFLCGDGERLELTHRATDRGVFALGALRAARWIAAQHPGIYNMKDVLFRS